MAIRYVDHGAIQVRGATGRAYQFSRTQPVQQVALNDARSLLRLRMFRPA